jgi:uncharacterized membrane protein
LKQSLYAGGTLEDSAMWTLWLGVALFAGPHLFGLLAPQPRDALKARLGENAWKGLYSLVALAGFVFLALGYLAGRSGPASLEMVYEPLYGARHLSYLLILAGFILIGASHGKGYIKAFVRHPMSLGIALWSIGHLLVNGETAVVVIFGMFLIIALLDIIFSTARGKLPRHEPRLRSDIIAVVAGVVLTAAFALLFHPYVLNIPVV